MSCGSAALVALRQKIPTRAAHCYIPLHPLFAQCKRVLPHHLNRSLPAATDIYDQFSPISNYHDARSLQIAEIHIAVRGLRFFGGRCERGGNFIGAIMVSRHQRYVTVARSA